jgi:hypothetical protein
MAPDHQQSGASPGVVTGVVASEAQQGAAGVAGKQLATAAGVELNGGALEGVYGLVGRMAGGGCVSGACDGASVCVLLCLVWCGGVGFRIRGGMECCGGDGRCMLVACSSPRVLGCGCSHQKHVTSSARCCSCSRHGVEAGVLAAGTAVCGSYLGTSRRAIWAVDASELCLRRLRLVLVPWACVPA